MSADAMASTTSLANSRGAGGCGLSPDFRPLEIAVGYYRRTTKIRWGYPRPSRTWPGDALIDGDTFDIELGTTHS